MFPLGEQTVVFNFNHLKKKKKEKESFEDEDGIDKISR